MWNYLIILNKNLVYAIPVFLTGGFLFGLLPGLNSADLLKQFILPFTFLMVYPMMVTLNIQHLKKGFDPRLQLTTQLINFAVIPLVALSMGSYFFGDQPYMALGLLLAALLPTSGMTISWTGFAKGNMGAAITMTVIGLTLGALAAPFYVQWLLGEAIIVDMMKVFQQITLIVFLPMAAGQLTRSALLKRYPLGQFKKEIAPRFPAISTVGVLGIVFIAMALKANTIIQHPELLVTILIPLLLLYLANFTFSTIIGRLFFTREDGIAMVYGTVMRNLSIALAIAINGFGKSGADAALVIALAYIIQVQSAAWYVKLTDKLFGEPAGLPARES